MADETIDREDLARQVADLEGTVRALTTQVERLSAQMRRMDGDMLPFRRIGPDHSEEIRRAEDALKRLDELQKRYEEAH